MAGILICGAFQPEADLMGETGYFGDRMGLEHPACVAGDQAKSTIPQTIATLINPSSTAALPISLARLARS